MAAPDKVPSGLQLVFGCVGARVKHFILYDGAAREQRVYNSGGNDNNNDSNAADANVVITDSTGDAAQEGLLKSFYDLGESLVFVENLQELDPNMFLGPFLDVIRSEDTTGPVTGLALSSVNKFLSYGMINPKNEASSSAAVQHIALRQCVRSKQP
ncbi:unnamed protein product [Notodromas monacha]|uniref:Uncharacterized protein n=1 Tax=Notodromas monacha TaxID=399045 RepID=A0A7R9BLQ9_9CRUS|nr:unnamed protein product [Notodromas monacha]CAG0916736.1 unnamed protein product [Notodromas monacha]